MDTKQLTAFRDEYTKLAAGKRQAEKELKLKSQLKASIKKREPGGKRLFSSPMRPHHPKTALLEAKLTKAQSGRNAAYQLSAAKDLAKKTTAGGRGLLNFMTLGLGTGHLTVTGRKSRASLAIKDGQRAGRDAKSLSKIIKGMGSLPKDVAKKKGLLTTLLRKLLSKGKM